MSASSAPNLETAFPPSPSSPFGEFAHSTTPPGTFLYPFIDSVDSRSSTYSQSAPSMTTYSLRIENMSAVGIFALLRLYPEGSLIGMDADGNFSIYKQDWLGAKLFAACCRTYYGQNGDQLCHLIDPIKQACSIYNHANKDVGIIFFIAYQGAIRLKTEYEQKGKTTVVATLAIISNLFLDNVLRCHHACPLPDIFPIKDLLASASPSKHSPMVSRISSAPISIPSSHSSAYLEKPFWQDPDLKLFSKRLIKCIFSAPETVVLDKRIQKLLKTIFTFNTAYRSPAYLSTSERLYHTTGNP